MFEVECERLQVSLWQVVQYPVISTCLPHLIGCTICHFYLFRSLLHPKHYPLPNQHHLSANPTANPHLYSDPTFIVPYSVLSATGYMESIATYRSLMSLRPNVRPFILSRATFPGSGSYAAHWNGTKRRYSNTKKPAWSFIPLQVITQRLRLTSTTAFL